MRRLTWTFLTTASGGPYAKIAQVTGSQFMYIDGGLSVGRTYYWVVRPLAADLNEACQSNEASVKIAGR